MTNGRENLIVTNCKPCEEAFITLTVCNQDGLWLTGRVILMTDGRENLIVTNCKPCEEALLTLKVCNQNGL